MKNVVATIPKSRFASWSQCLATCKACDGEQYYWLVNTANLPKQSGTGAVCFMVYDGQIRGYFDIVDTGPTEKYRKIHRIGKRRNTQSLLLANWHPYNGPAMTGFQGWHYTELKP